MVTFPTVNHCLFYTGIPISLFVQPYTSTKLTNQQNMSSIIKSAKSIFPTLDRILVQRIKVPQQTSSGIYIPEKNVPKNNLATVIAVGPGFNTQSGELIKPSVKAGDKVLIPPHGGSPINIEKEEYLLLRDSDILARIQE